MVTYAQLKALKPAEFEEAADGWHTVSSAAGEAMDRVNNQVTAGMRRDLTGVGSDAAVNRLKRLGENFQYTQTGCGLIRSALNDLARDLAAAKRKLTSAVSEATGAGYKVDDNGAVKWNEKGNEATAKGFADRIGDALKAANEADATWAATLGQLKARNDLTVTDADWADSGRDASAVRKSVGSDLGAVPKGKSPAENAAWWRGLTDEQRADQIALNPAAVGALDGLPATVRDDANRTVLAQKEGAFQTELNGIPPQPPKYTAGSGSGYPAAKISDAWKQWNEKYGDRKRDLEGKLRGMHAIQQRFDATGKRQSDAPGDRGLPEAYLLGFDPEKDGRAIVANGNPDTAAHTGVYIPGTGADLEHLGREMRKADSLWQQSQLMADGQPVSTITWLGYDAPGLKEAPFGGSANNGAPILNRFMEGINTSHAPGSDSHNTIVGHSYGSTVIGSAARQGDLQADDIVTVGSPGVQVGRATDMDVPKGHVWNQTADGDWVPYFGAPGHGGRDTGFWGIGDYVIPSDDKFGANQMSTDTSGHTNYWTPGKRSIQNQAAVIAGQLGKVEYE